MKPMKQIIILSLIIFTLSCKKDEQIIEPVTENSKTSGEVTLNFTHMAGNELMKISADEAYSITTPKYKNNYGDTFSVIDFKYYISNIKLRKDDGSYYVGKESYHLVNSADSNRTCKIKLSEVPFGSYTSIEFMIGIDSTRNLSGAQTGDLDPVHGMYWDWSQGYIFMRFFGYSNSAPANTSHNLTFDIGGTGNERKISLPLSQFNLMVTKDNFQKVYLKTDVLELFKGPNSLSFSFLNNAMTPKQVLALVENYTDIFTVSAVK